MRAPERISGAILLISIAVSGVWVFFVPWFGGVPSAPAGGDYLSHVALTAAALDTIKETGSLPISTDKIVPGVEYPYLLLGNFAFNVLAAYVSALTGTSAYVGVFVVLSASFIAGVVGIYGIARQHQINVLFAAILAFLYASGPYLSLNLFIRDAYPEYMMWQVMPLLYLALQRSLRQSAGPLWVLVGAVALAVPFYVHKLVAPYVILTLLALIFYQHKPSMQLIGRTGLIGIIALLLSAPPWLAMRGIMGTDFQIHGPTVYNHDIWNFLWPYLQNSLTAADGAEGYRYRFGLQVGLVPVLGIVLGVLSLAVSRSLDHLRRVAVLTALFALYTALIIGAFGVWDSRYAPLAMRAIQFTYRLLGLAHFVGFLALFNALSVLVWPRRSVMRQGAGVALQVLFAGVATLSVRTYWHDPDYTAISAASITPAQLVDTSHLYLPPTHGNLDVDRAVAADGWLMGWLVVPPSTVALESPTDAVVLTGNAARPTTPQQAGERAVRIYGFTNERQSGTVRRSDLRDFLEGRWRAAGDEDPVARQARQLGVDPSRDQVRIPNTTWDARLLGEQVVPASGEIEMRVHTGPDVRAIAVTCTWTVPAQEVNRSLSSERRVCLRIRVLAAAVTGGDYFDPQPIPPSVRTRLPLGTSVIDARDLAPGHYVLPSMRYHFLRVRTERGEVVPTYEYDGRPVVRHAGGVQSYVVEYDLLPERLALVAGVSVFGVYAVAYALLRRRAKRCPA
jgi:hypothetical protein